MVEWVHIQVHLVLLVQAVVVVLAVKMDSLEKILNTVIQKVVVVVVILVHEVVTVEVEAVLEALLGTTVATVVWVVFALSGQEALDNSQAQTLVMLSEIQCTEEVIGVEQVVQMDEATTQIIPTCLVQMA
jgi:hypothetical protein